MAIALATAALFVQWGTLKITADDIRDGMTVNGQKVGGNGIGEMLPGMVSSMFGRVTVPVSGRSGTVWA